MKTLNIFLSIIIIFMFFGIISAQQSITPISSGKELFLEKKCNSCHTIISKGVKARYKFSTKAVDLSDVKETKEQLISYLNQETKIHDYKHPIIWKDSEEELLDLVNFILEKPLLK